MKHETIVAEQAVALKPKNKQAIFLRKLADRISDHNRPFHMGYCNMCAYGHARQLLGEKLSVWATSFSIVAKASGISEEEWEIIYSGTLFKTRKGAVEYFNRKALELEIT